MKRVVILASACVAVACAEAVDTSWHEEAGMRWRALEVTGTRKAGFTILGPDATGITHANVVEDEHALANRNLLIGAGAAVADIDGDGLVDVFLASVERPAALYRNAGNLRFEDVTATSGLSLATRATTGATFADIDGDGDADLLVGTLSGPLTLWHNDGKGKFVDATSGSGLDSGYAATTMTLADVEGDGDLDLYVATYKGRNALDAYTPQARSFDQVVRKVGQSYQVLPEWQHEFRVEDRPDLGGIVRSQRAEEDLFYLNDGTGRFTRAATSGPRWLDEDGRPLAQAPDYFSLAARFYDVNADGAPDLYVCNDFEDPDQFWLNDGRGTFRLAPRLALRATSNTCMSVDFGDVNRDGHVDFFTADMLSPTREARQRQIPTHTPLPKRVGESSDRAQWMRNALQVSRGDGTWAQLADFAGVAASDWTWGSAFLDVDLDGDEDLLTVAGHRWDIRDADTFDRIRNAFPRVPWNREQGEFPRLAVPNAAFMNAGDGTFTAAGTTWGWAGDSAISHGIALADLDGDGDIDPVVTRLGDAPRVYRNEARGPRIAVRLRGKAPNVAGIGAVVSVTAPGTPPQSREVTQGGHYLSGSDPLLVFAMPADSVALVRVRWRTGHVSRFEGRANRLYEVDEALSSAPPPVATPAGTSLFTDATALLGGHRHEESAFDDYTRQPLLPNRFSQFGPSLAWVDVDGDGREDLVAGAGRGGRLAVLRNGTTGFTARYGEAVPADIGGIVPIVRNGRVVVHVTESSWEAPSAAVGLAIPGVAAFEMSATGVMPAREVAPAEPVSLGALAAGDVDGDGNLDLFVGARVIPGAWPLPGRSRLLRGQADGTFAEQPADRDAIASLGLVTGATFGDLDGNGAADLVVASEWGPVHVLLNRNGRLVDETSRFGLGEVRSRWMGVTVLDADSDGRLDLLATSWGRNLPWRPTPARPLALLVARAANQVSLVFTEQDTVTGREVPTESLSRLGVSLPVVRERVPSYHAYAAASVDSVLGDMARNVVRVGATTLDHTLFLNRGTRFEARALPAAAQVAPSFGAVVADWNGDGHEDLYLSQNFYPTEIGAMRQDAGAGLVLRGEGNGNFIPLPVKESGISVLGDQRGAATADYDLDGRPDLAVSQNGWVTRLFRNSGAREGVRVKLAGPPGNPQGIGAQLRIVRGARRGPVREVRAGTGPWSTDGAVTIMARPEGADSLWVRWPGGREVTVGLSAARDITVNAPR